VKLGLIVAGLSILNADPLCAQMTMPGMGAMQNTVGVLASGTSVEPKTTSESARMFHIWLGNWTLTFHANGLFVDTQQTGSRGADKLFSTNWLMPMVARDFGRQTGTFRTMLSLEPATGCECERRKTSLSLPSNAVRFVELSVSSYAIGHPLHCARLLKAKVRPRCSIRLRPSVTTPGSRHVLKTNPTSCRPCFLWWKRNRVFRSYRRVSGISDAMVSGSTGCSPTG
jgi:hypothetical protein